MTSKLATSFCALFLFANCAFGAENTTSLKIWPDLAPGEVSRETGTAEPKRKGENPPITRLRNIRQPTLDIFLADKPNGTAIVVLPGGGFIKVVPDKEGSEVAPFLNKLGISVFVLNYRTSESVAKGEPLWKRPVQDAQRTIRLLHQNSKKWNLDTKRIGVLAFSAGGQVGSVLHTAQEAHYESVDDIDKHPFQPAFSLLIYPWRIQDRETRTLIPAIKVSKNNGPAFIVHTHDDNSTAAGAAQLYIAFKEKNVPAELHIYQNGGHGYGIRPVNNSVIHTWADRARDWLVIRGLGRAE